MIRVRVEKKAYGSAPPVLREIDLSIAAGETVALMGRSGIGKTTLLHLIAGLDDAFKGRIDGTAGAVGFVFQSPRLLPWRTALENLRLVAPQRSDAELLDELRATGVADAAALYPAQLSLGMARRVAIARALAVRPKLLLLDEPFASLDPGTSARLTEMLSALLQRIKVPALLVSHDVDQALEIADRIVVLGGNPAGIILDQATSSATREDILSLLSEQ